MIQAVGRPDRTSDGGNRSYWFYDEKALDKVSGKRSFASVKIQNDVVRGVSFETYSAKTMKQVKLCGTVIDKSISRLAQPILLIDGLFYKS
ncbi:hypothetical protein [Coleofasciculus sp.]|uniref:hypothetical protein n=1 Tax=Coleofasciculus sp. TaxID=3100458 RepID=UPI003A4A0F7A